jgi:HEAT repeat protein
MNIHFCNVCNESVPQADVDEGRALLRNGRVICARCEAAMSALAPSTAAPARAEPVLAPPPVPPPPVLRAPLPVAGTVTPAAGALSPSLLLSAAALLIALGGGIYLFGRFDRRVKDLEGELARARTAEEQRSELASRELAGDVRALRTDVEGVRAADGELARRLDDEAKEREAALAALRAQVDGISEWGAGVGSLEKTLERHEAELGELAREGSELREELAALGERLARSGETDGDPSAVDSAPTPAPGAADAAATPAWVQWLGGLASTDSGTRWRAVDSLGATGDRSVATHLVPMLRDSDIFVRMAAARHLGQLGAVEATPALIDALDDSEAGVREQALGALRALTGQDLPFDPLAKDAERAKRVKAWRDWWERARGELLGAKEGS